MLCRGSVKRRGEPHRPHSCEPATMGGSSAAQGAHRPQFAAQPPLPCALPPHSEFGKLDVLVANAGILGKMQVRVCARWQGAWRALCHGIIVRGAAIWRRPSHLHTITPFAGTRARTPPVTAPRGG